MIVLLLGGAFQGFAKAKTHPPLVNLDSSNCTTCHDQITDKKYVHTAIGESGCDSCHEIKKVAGKTVVELTEKRSRLCFTCHSDIEALGKKKYAHPTLEEWCNVCHKSHSSDRPALLTGSMEAICSDCHDIQEKGFKDKHGRQPVNLLGCTPCHDPHGSDHKKMMKGSLQHAPFKEGQCGACHKRARGTELRLRGVGARLCYACHGDKEKAFAQASVHTPVKKGECAGCHDPHLADEKKLLKNKGNALCFECHRDIQGLMKEKHVHPPARESCANCHDPHASAAPRQLSQDLVPLCLECHDTDDKNFNTKHYNQKPADLHCGECHNPHGSKNAKLLNSFTHSPFADKDCGTCHEDGGSKIKLTADTVNDLCVTCHDDKGMDDSKKGMVRHGVLETGSCTDCHSAHAAPRKYILKDHTSRLCTNCHDDRAEERKNSRFIHPIIDSVGCEACHESHFSRNKSLLLETPNRLCLECHVRKSGQKPMGKDVTLFGKIKLKDTLLDTFAKIILNSARTRGHPQAGHIVSGEVIPEKLKNKRLRGLTFSGDMTCLSCHDAHAGNSPQLFANGIASRFQLCLKCHAK